MPESYGAEFRKEKNILISGAAELRLQLSATQIWAFLDYLSLIIQWTAKINLTSIKKPELIVRHHFLDSLAICHYINNAGGRLLDVGSGAGFPGVPLKIVYPEKEIVLVEPNRKKANFLRELVRRLNLNGIAIMEKRAEELNIGETELFDEVVTRALGSAELFLKLSVKLLTPRGKSLIMHGPKGAELFRKLEAERMKLGFANAWLEEFQLPIGNEQRCLLVFS